VFRVDGDVDDLEEKAAITDNAAHADGFAVFADDDGINGVGESSGCGICALWA